MQICSWWVNAEVWSHASRRSWTGWRTSSASATTSLCGCRLRFRFRFRFLLSLLLCNTTLVVSTLCSTFPPQSPLSPSPVFHETIRVRYSSVRSHPPTHSFYGPIHAQSHSQSPFLNSSSPPPAAGGSLPTLLRHSLRLLPVPVPPPLPPPPPPPLLDKQLSLMNAALQTGCSNNKKYKVEKWIWVSDNSVSQD